jgi:hypothetical protein
MYSYNTMLWDKDKVVVDFGDTLEQLFIVKEGSLKVEK